MRINFTTNELLIVMVRSEVCLRELVFRSDVASAQERQDWNAVVDYYSVVFESFANMNVAFKVISLCLLAFTA